MPFFNETQLVHLAFIMVFTFSRTLPRITNTNNAFTKWESIYRILSGQVRKLFEIVDKNKRKKAIIKK